MKKIPCEGCICFPMCRERSKKRRSVVRISEECTSLYAFIFGNEDYTTFCKGSRIMAVRRMMLHE